MSTDWDKKSEKVSVDRFAVDPSSHEKEQNKRLDRDLGGTATPGSGRFSGAKGDRELDGMFKIEEKCVHEDSEIDVGYGEVVRAGDLSAGDYVVAKDGQTHRINKVFKRNYFGKLLLVKPFGDNRDNQFVTPEHKYYAIKSKKCTVSSSLNTVCKPTCQRSGRRGCSPAFGEYVPDWIEAKDLEVGDFVALPRIHYGCFSRSIYMPNLNKSKSPIKVDLDNDWMRFFGLYVAEGCCSLSAGNITLTTAVDEHEVIAFIDLFCAKLGINVYRRVNKNPKGTSLQSTISNRVLRDFLCVNFGRVSKKKRVPSFIFHAPEELKLDFIRQAWIGDGHIDNVCLQYTTSSKQLVIQLHRLLVSVGIAASFGVQSKKRGSWQVRIYSDEANKLFSGSSLYKESRSSRYWFSDDLLWVPVQKIVSKDVKDCLVKNFEIDGDYSYIVNAITHNSTRAQSIAIRRKFLEKIYEEAKQQNKEPALAFSFLMGKSPAPSDWIAVPVTLFREMYEVFKEVKA